MQYFPLSVASAAAIALLAAPAADAQWGERVGSPTEQAGPLANPALVLPPSYGAYALQSLYPVCTVRREQFQDSYGWRVRDVRVCF